MTEHDKQQEAGVAEEAPTPPEPKRTLRRYGPSTVLVIAIVSGISGAFIGAGLKESTPPQPSLAPPPELAADLTLGESAETAAGNTVTAYEVAPLAKQPKGLAEGETAWGAEIEWCAGVGQSPVEVDNLMGLFTLEMPNKERLVTSVAIDPGGTRLSALTGTVGPEDCVRGRLGYLVPKDGVPEFFVFSGVTVARWVIP